MVCLLRDHAAPDVDAYRSGNDCAGGRDDRTNARALPTVRVGHQRDVTNKEREPARALGLSKCIALDLIGSDEQLLRLVMRRHG
jgi:hypothetical protein